MRVQIAKKRIKALDRLVLPGKTVFLARMGRVVLQQLCQDHFQVRLYDYSRSHRVGRQFGGDLPYKCVDVLWNTRFRSDEMGKRIVLQQKQASTHTIASYRDAF